VVGHPSNRISGTETLEPSSLHAHVLRLPDDAPMDEESPDVTVTGMLLAEPPDFSALRDFIGRIGTRTNLALDLKQIDSLDAVGLAVTRRILGVSVFGPSLCSLVFSLTRLTNAERRTFSIVGDVFGNYISDEFPNTTRDFLQASLASSAEGSSLRALLEDLLRHMQEREKLYDELPQLQELKPAHEKLQSYRVAMLKEQREILEHAEQQSVFASLFPKINLKYGRSVITEVQGQFTVPTHVNHISHSVEIPRSELRDPVAGILRRDAYLKAGK
jgi:ribosomal protein L17